MLNFFSFIIGKFRAFFRFLLFLFLTIFTILKLVFFAIFGQLDLAKGMQIRRQWATNIIAYLGIEFEKRGVEKHKNVLYISNHRSYIDPIVVVSDLLALVLAKKEVSYWPLIGYGMKLTGSFFVKREEKSSRKEARDNIAKTIKEGHSLLLYPEGTTTILPTTLPFKPRVFQMAAENQVKIIPIVVEYADQSVAFINDDIFLPHFFKVFAKPKIKGIIVYGAPIEDTDGEVLRQKVQEWIHQRLGELQLELGLKG